MKTNSSNTNYQNPSLLIEADDDKFLLSEPVTKTDMYHLMLQMLEEEYFRTDCLTSPDSVRDYLHIKLAKYQHEVFCCIYLNSQHEVIGFEELFRGTIDSASVYPREVVKHCLNNNAAAVIFCHNHPSGSAKPSEADKSLTRRLQDALGLVDITVLDHLVIAGAQTTSFAEVGLL